MSHSVSEKVYGAHWHSVKITCMIYSNRHEMAAEQNLKNFLVILFDNPYMDNTIKCVKVSHSFKGDIFVLGLNNIVMQSGFPPSSFATGAGEDLENVFYCTYC